MNSLLRHPRDKVSLVTVLGYPVMLGLNYTTLHSWTVASLSCLYAYTVGCIMHCHGHQPFFHLASANRALDWVFAILRVDGCDAWRVTHSVNHHRYANRPGDYTWTYRYTQANGFFPFVIYLIHAVVAYSGATLRTLATHVRKGTRRGWHWVFQWAFLALIWTLLWRRDPRSCIQAIWIPQAFGVLAMVGTGYFQHHHAATDDVYASARNFTGTWLNRLTFNHGYHLVHHLHIRMHWSEWPQAHARIQHLIPAELNQRSLLAYFGRLFVGQYLFPKWRTTDFRS
jgi:beta-carotene hydroxylase